MLPKSVNKSTDRLTNRDIESSPCHLNMRENASQDEEVEEVAPAQSKAN